MLDGKKCWDILNVVKLQEIVSNQGAFNRFHFLHKTYGCLTERTGYYGYRYSTPHNKISQFLCDSYDFIPPNPQNKCDGCIQTFLVRYALILSNGGLVIIFHNKIRDKIIHFIRQAFYPHCVCGKPPIHLVRSRSDEEVWHEGTFLKTWGGMSIWGLWEI